MATILILVANPSHAQSIRDGITGHRLISPADTSNDAEVELVLADEGGLHHHRQRLDALTSAAHPVCLPLLLIIDTAAFPEAEPLVFDLIRAPFDTFELNTRLRALLHLRRLSEIQRRGMTQADKRLRETLRALNVARMFSELVVHAHSETDLLQSACRTLVAERIYSAAWIGYVGDDPIPTVSVQAHAGAPGEVLTRIDSGCNGNAPNWGVIRRAIDNAEPVVVEDMGAYPALARWGGATPGSGAAIILPLRAGNSVFGALVIHAAAAHVFGARERKLLARAADGLAYGIRVLRDRAETRRARERVALLDYRDQLTGLPNRTRVLQVLGNMLHGKGDEACGGAVLFVDLDGFKLITDALGHASGDRVLKQVATRLAGNIRAQDLVGRQGGDEFIILVPYRPRTGRGGSAATDVAQLRQIAGDVARRVIAALEVPFVVRGGERYLSASIGISLFPRDATSVSRLLSQADGAMYFAKALGGGCYEFYSAFLSRTRRRRLSVETRLHRAVARREFQLHYQPIVDLANGRIRAVEALLRWPRGQGPEAVPDKFVPILEQTGLIIPLGEWVMEQAYNALSRWTPIAPDLSVSVNLAMAQLWQPELASRLMRMATAAGVQASHIELEITEGATVIDGPARVERTVRGLCDAGFRIALDDFGTGYSSFDRLRRLPITTLKIDQRFLAAVPSDCDSSVLVSTIVQLGHNLGMRIVAEGIENEAQRRFLVGIRCDDGQGHLFSPARPFDEIEQLLRQQVDVPCD